MNPTTHGLTFAIALFLAMPVLLETGRRLGARHLELDSEGARQGFGVVEGAVFSLLGLLIAFTFSGAAARFDGRRQLVIQEANNIGTAYLRLDLLPVSAQPPLRAMFRQYLDSRLETYRKLPDIQASRVELARSLQLQSEIWTASVEACKSSAPSPAHMLLLPALNEMFDIVTTRTENANIHPPLIIFVMLGILSLAAALLAGYCMASGKSRSWVHILAFSAVMSVTVYVIMDIEYPRLGFIRVDNADRVLVDLRQSMGK